MKLRSYCIPKFLGGLCLSVLLSGPLSCSSGPRVILLTKGGKEIAFRVEVADTPAKRAQGLQYRTDLGDDQGMIFLFPVEEVQTFWMRNTPTSLDMIFIASNQRVVGIIHEAVPFSTETLSVPAPSQFVLEVKGGLSRRRGIEVGDAVRFEEIPLEGIKG